MKTDFRMNGEEFWRRASYGSEGILGVFQGFKMKHCGERTAVGRKDVFESVPI
jgi:hypothetical protein